MRIEKLIVVLRHNINLRTDIALAIREIDALARTEGDQLQSPLAVDEALDHPRVIKQLIFATKVSTVALVYRQVDLNAVNRIALRSAFAQELLIQTDKSTQAAVIDRLTLPYVVVNEFDRRTMIVPALYYVLESESVLHREMTSTVNRVRYTARLLVKPFLFGDTAETKRVRQAKQTSLLLSHDLHIFKAKFFPRMVRALLNIYAKPEDIVLDPFCGSGTALLEASLLGHRVYGVDIDPVCTMISECKVTPFISGKARNEIFTLKSAVTIAEALEADAHSDSASFPQELKTKLLRRDKRDGTSYTDEIVSDFCRLDHLVRGHQTEWKTSLPKVLISDAVTKKVRYRYVGVGNGRYTVYVIKQSIIGRLLEKVNRAEQLFAVFPNIAKVLPWPLGEVSAIQGDARDTATWEISEEVDIILTSPPYLPASSGREHYAKARAMSFSLLGLSASDMPNLILRENSSEYKSQTNLEAFDESKRLLQYLASDRDATDPQRDAMRYARKYLPTQSYLHDMLAFFGASHRVLSKSGLLILVVAHQHTFYSHRRSEIEHIVNGVNLYTQLAEQRGFKLKECIEMELAKASNSRARPRAKEDYYEVVLIYEKI